MPVKGKINPTDRNLKGGNFNRIGSDEDELMSGNKKPSSGKGRLSEDSDDDIEEEDGLEKELEGFRITDSDDLEEEEPKEKDDDDDDEFDNFFGKGEDEDDEKKEGKGDYEEEEGIFF